MEFGACMLEGCGQLAPWIPVLVFRTTRAELSIPVCGAHRLVVKCDYFLTDEVWETIREAFAADKRRVPPREKIELDFRHVAEGYCH